MKKDWELKRLDEVCVVERGSSPRPIKEYQTQSDDGVNWIKIGDTKGVEKYIYSTKEKITKEGAKQSRFVKEGDFILTNSMSFGNPYIMKTEGYIHDGWFVLRLKNYIDTEYFWYLLVSPLVQEQFNTLANGAIVKNISGDLVKKVVLPIPPLPEQQRIVSVLDEAFASIAQAKSNAERNLVNARELFESVLEEIFSNPDKKWKRTTIGDEIELLVGFAFKSKGYTDSEDGIRLLRGDNIIQGSLRWDGVKRWKSSEYSEYSTYTLKEGDLVLAMDRPWVKAGLKYSMISKSDLPSLLVQRTACLRSGNNLDNPFLSYIIRSRNFIQHILGVQTGIGVPHISGGQIKDFEFSLPSLAEQRAIVGRLEALSAETGRLEEIYQQKVESLDELKKSVLQKAFNGEL